jgi:hypothetical protein
MATPACNEKPPARAHGDPVRDRVPDQVTERIGVPVAGKPRVLHGPLDQATPFQQTTETLGDPLDQRLQLLGTGLAHRAEHRRTDALGPIRTIQQQQVKVNVEVPRRSKTLHQRHRPSVALGARQSRPAQQEP